VTDNVSLPDPPAANQDKDEPIAATPAESPQSSGADAGESSRTPGDQGELPRPMEVDNDQSAANTASAATMPAGTDGGVPTPGDSQGVAVPSVHAAAGTSEESGEVEAVRTTALAAPGKPDGEVDTRT
jgi:hypothetical protein